MVGDSHRQLVMSWIALVAIIAIGAAVLLLVIGFLMDRWS